MIASRPAYRPRGSTSSQSLVRASSRSCRHASERVGLEPLGAHRLRHTVATELLRAGANLREIGLVLRHQRLSTTAIYAKVDHLRLATLARPWPGGAA